MNVWSVNLKTAVDYNANPENLQAATRSTLDHSIICRIAQGDEQAMVELIDRHGDAVARLIGRLTAWHTDGDDILQEVLLTVWKKANSFDHKGSLEGWLKKIAINRCRNHFRALNAIQRNIEKFATVFVGRHQPEPRQTLYEEVEHTPLNEALKRLSSDDRTALVLFYLEEMPGSDVAKTLKLKPESFHVRLHRARAKLKKLMEELESHA